MYVKVRLYGTLRRLSNDGTPGLWVGEVPEGLDIAGLIEHLGTRVEEVAAATVNGTPQALDCRLKENDRVVLVTPVGGG